jgi:cytochrome c553
MNRLAILASLAVVTGALAADRPDWAFPVTPPGQPRDTVKLHSLQGSTKQYTEAQINDGFNTPDWFPDMHPPMPKIVASGGPRPAASGCSLCHLPTGDGHPESASLAGMTETYIIRQMEAFKTGQRSNARAPSMINMAKVLSDEEIRDAAKYFSQLKPTRGFVKVVETDTVPKTYIGPGAMRFADPKGGTEPLANRIINIPIDAERAEMRDPRIGFIDHVPVGSIKRGEALATTGGGKTTPCGVCHGPDMRGLADIPPLAGRHATYLYRQIRDMQEGMRKGGQTVLMAAVVAPLTDDDMIALAAYMASLAP